MCTVRVKLYLSRQFTRVNSRIDGYKKQVNIVVAVLVVAFAVYLGWLESIALSFAFLSIIVATFFASRSLKRTSESLELTRKMIRPFLHMIGGTIQPYETKERYTVLPFVIYNSGSLPATSVSVDIDFFSYTEEVTEDNTSSVFETATKSPETIMILPKDNYTEEYVFDRNNTNDNKLLECIKQGKVKLRIHIAYQSLSRKHSMIQTFEICKHLWDEKPVLIPIPPQEWK